MFCVFNEFVQCSVFSMCSYNVLRFQCVRTLFCVFNEFVPCSVFSMCSYNVLCFQ